MQKVSKRMSEELKGRQPVDLSVIKVPATSGARVRVAVDGSISPKGPRT